MIHYIALTGTDTELSKTIDGKVRAIWVFPPEPSVSPSQPCTGFEDGRTRCGDITNDEVLHA
jgi:hypothetical protein